MDDESKHLDEGQNRGSLAISGQGRWEPVYWPTGLLNDSRIFRWREPIAKTFPFDPKTRLPTAY